MQMPQIPFERDIMVTYSVLFISVELYTVDSKSRNLQFKTVRG